MKIPETREALAEMFNELGVREGTYHLYGAHLEDAISIDKRPEGWVVFYSERGTESVLGTFSTEVEACAKLYAETVREPHNFYVLIAGPSPAAEADEAFDAWLTSRHITRAGLAPDDWKYDDVPWDAGPYWRRYFMRFTTERRLSSGKARTSDFSRSSPIAAIALWAMLACGLVCAVGYFRRLPDPIAATALAVLLLSAAVWAIAVFRDARASGASLGRAAWRSVKLTWKALWELVP